MTREINLGKKDDLGKLLSKTPSIKDLEIRSRLDLLRSDNNNDNFQPPPQPPPRPPHLPQPPQPPRLDDFFQPQAPPSQTPRENGFFGPAPRIPPSLSASPLSRDDDYFLEKSIIQNIDENRQNLIGELQKVIEKSEKKTEKFEVDNSISSYFNDAEETLDRNYLEKN